MKKTTVYVTATALPSCLLFGDEADAVRRVRVTVSTAATRIGRNVRNRLHRLAWEAIQAEAVNLPKFPGCSRPVGGMCVTEPVTESDRQMRLID